MPRERMNFSSPLGRPFVFWRSMGMSGASYSAWDVSTPKRALSLAYALRSVPSLSLFTLDCHLWGLTASKRPVYHHDHDGDLPPIVVTYTLHPLFGVHILLSTYIASCRFLFVFLFLSE